MMKREIECKSFVHLLFSGFDFGFQSGACKYEECFDLTYHAVIYNGCVQPALTGLYNGCCRHNRGQLCTRHQQMSIEGAV